MGALGLVYEPLFNYDPLTNEYIPWLAESGEWTADDEYTIKLREGITWADGEPLTADDVVFTLELGKNPSRAVQQHLDLHRIGRGDGRPDRRSQVLGPAAPPVGQLPVQPRDRAGAPLEGPAHGAARGSAAMWTWAPTWTRKRAGCPSAPVPISTSRTTQTRRSGRSGRLVGHRSPGPRSQAPLHHRPRQQHEHHGAWASSSRAAWTSPTTSCPASQARWLAATG